MSKPLVPLSDQPWIAKNIPFLTFFSRASTWWMIIFVLATQWAIHFKHPLWWTELPNLPDGTPGEWIPVTLYDFLGAFLTVPALVSVIMFVWSLCLHLFFRGTVDKDTHDGTTLCDWGVLTSFERTMLHVVIRVGFFIGICILCAGLAKGAEPDQVARWRSARIDPAHSIELDLMVNVFRRDAHRYEAITRMAVNGVPAPIIFCLHQRESSGNFRCSLAQGDPLSRRSTHVPRGRIPYVEPPYSFEVAAADAIYNVDRLDLINWNNLQESLQGIESYNGLGVQKYHPGFVSGYVWAATSLYRGGKYTGDGHWDPLARDRQLGVAAILLRLQASGVVLSWP